MCGKLAEQGGSIAKAVTTRGRVNISVHGIHQIDEYSVFSFANVVNSAKCKVEEFGGIRCVDKYSSVRY